MKTNDLVQIDDKVYRVLHIEHERILVIDCVNRQMPVWISTNEVKALEIISETDVAESITPHIPYDELTQEERRVAHERYTIIAPIIAFITDDQKKKELIALAAEKNEITKATVRTYLKTYLTYQKIEALAPTRKSVSKELSPDEKNFRWTLNKFYYTQHKNTLKTAYILMLKERYTDSVGKLTEHPSLSQFRYFYRKTKHIQNELITRKGLSNYQRNSRPLLGTVQDYAPTVGYGLLDSTICDIYLVNNSSQLVGRPILTLCVDAYSSLVCGYLLSWEGGTFSLQGLLQNVITDKTQWCSRVGIIIEKDDWPCKSLPGILVTDRGPEYTSQTFAQVTELGVQIENLEAFRPDRKGVIEKALDCIQQLYIPLLRGKGVVEKDYQERGIHDYRKDARLTIDKS